MDWGTGSVNRRLNAIRLRQSGTGFWENTPTSGSASDSIAASEWNRLMNKHVVFGGKQQVIQQHQSNGRTFWRLRVAGFGSLSEARQFCAALKSAGTDCLALN